MKLLISVCLLVMLCGCGQAPTQEPTYAPSSINATKRLATSISKLIKRVAAREGVAPNVANAVEEVLVKGTRRELTLMVSKKTRVPAALKRGTVHLDDPHLTDQGATIVSVQGAVARLQTKVLLDGMLEELTQALPPHELHKLAGSDDVASLRKQVGELIKDMPYLPKS